MSITTNPSQDQTPSQTDANPAADDHTTASRGLLQPRSVFNEVEGQPEPLASSPLSEKIIITSAVTIPLLACVYGGYQLWQYGWMTSLDLGLLVVGWYITGLGITVGFHRLLAHRSFETTRPVRYFWMSLGSLAVQGSPLMWCAVHRRHHQCSDKPGDPHSPHLHDGGVWQVLRGFVHSHTGWLYSPYWSDPSLKKFIPDLMSDKPAVVIDRFYYLWVIASLTIPALIGGLVVDGLATWSWQGAGTAFLWGGLVRICVTHHITWSINSVCHVFGKQDYQAGDASRNNVIFGFLAHGEGWHNNHHAFPNSARHGLKWWQFDLSWVLIRLMERLRVAWDVKVPAENMLAGRRL